ncbi:MAG: hypothetical protein KC433_10570 [Anaerolineales bacterium]|nr:hypothetical protein [Anaerolineales bacterium]MCB8936861.1 hypothetical protein [Ardenticatenaceae bacterium]
MEHPTYQLNVRYAVEFVKQLLPQVDAATSLILVGDLSQCRGKLDGAVREAIEVENPVFSQSYGHLTIPLSGLNKYELKKNVLHRIGLRQLITEVQMERYGRLLCHAPNKFNDPAQLSDWFRPHFVQELAHEGIITLAEASVQRVSSVKERPFRFQFAYQ